MPRKSGGLRDAERTKARLLAAARSAFSEHGLSGARVSAIAAAAGVNKQLVYYYFGDKEALYARVLLETYTALREGEQHLDLAALPPLEAIRRLIEFNFDFLVGNPHFVRLLTVENQLRARHLKRIEGLSEMHAALGETLVSIIDRGVADGTFGRRIDPIDFYIALASLCYFPVSNAHSLRAIFGRDLMSGAEVRHRRALIADLLVTYLVTPAGSPGAPVPGLSSAGPSER